MRRGQIRRTIFCFVCVSAQHILQRRQTIFQEARTMMNGDKRGKHQSANGSWASQNTGSATDAVRPRAYTDDNARDAALATMQAAEFASFKLLMDMPSASTSEKL
jgi:hypothetical protein